MITRKEPWKVFDDTDQLRSTHNEEQEAAEKASDISKAENRLAYYTGAKFEVDNRIRKSDLAAYNFGQPTPNPEPDPIPEPDPEPTPDPIVIPPRPPLSTAYPGVPMPDWDYNSEPVNPRRITGGSSVTFNGTPDKIDYVNATGVIFNQEFTLRGQYGVLIGGIFEGLDGSLIYSGHHIAVRNANIRDSDTGNGAVVYGGGHDIIIKDCAISGAGADKWTGQDHHGIKIGGNRIWIMGCTIDDCIGDGIQVGDQNNSPEAIKDIFILGNSFYGNNQTGAWVKNASNVIIAYNVARNHNTGGDSVAASSGGQYKLTNVWWMYNDFDDSPVGIRIASTDGGSGRYVVSNRVRTNKQPSSNTFGEGWDLQSWSSENVVAYNNDALSAVGARAPLVGYNPIVTQADNVNFSESFNIQAVKDKYKQTFGVDAPF